MTLEDVFRMPLRHFAFHLQQLARDEARDHGYSEARLPSLLVHVRMTNACLSGEQNHRIQQRTQQVRQNPDVILTVYPPQAAQAEAAQPMPIRAFATQRLNTDLPLAHGLLLG